MPGAPTVPSKKPPVKSAALTTEAISTLRTPSVCTPTMREFAVPCGITAVRPEEHASEPLLTHTVTVYAPVVLFAKYHG